MRILSSDGSSKFSEGFLRATGARTVGGPGACPPEKSKILDAQKCNFPHFQKTFHENMQVPSFLKFYHFSITSSNRYTVQT